VSWSVVLAVVVTALIVLVLLNLSSGEKKISKRIAPIYAVTDPQFQRSMGSLLGPSLAHGNRVVGLRNGREIFPAMLDAIRQARRTICFETYIYWSGEIGRAFADALVERARSGIKVHVLLDWIGSVKMEGDLLERLSAGAVQVRRYHPPRWYNLGRLNNRTHRKLLVVDGEVGFTGGVGIADNWMGNADGPDHWRDSHYRLEGPAVAQMQAAFLDNWMKTEGEVLHGEEYFPSLETSGESLAQVFRSSPNEGSESVRLMYLLSIAGARRSVRIAASYFVPDDLSIETIVGARARGVHVTIVLPGATIDTEVTRMASRSRWGPLLRAGVEIYEYRPTMYHCKIMIVDDIWVSVGSTNFDNRSFRLNDEANLNVYDRDFASSQVADFDRDLARSDRVTLDAWSRRPLRERVVDRLAGLLRSQL